VWRLLEQYFPLPIHPHLFQSLLLFRPMLSAHSSIYHSYVWTSRILWFLR
jgi:hypothetical protein